MTLPIAITRPAPEGHAPPPHDPAPGTPESTRAFRRALASAMEDEAAKAGSAGERQRARDQADAARRGDTEADRGEARTPSSSANDEVRAWPMPGDAPVSSLPLDVTTGPWSTPARGRSAPSDEEGATEHDAGEGTFPVPSLEEATARLEALPLGRPGEVVALGGIPAGSPAATTAPVAPGAPDGMGRGGARATVRPTHDPDEPLRAAAAALVERSRATSRELAGLVPDLRTRLERVIERMEEEYGYTVEVVETVRSQERQDALFAQGRTKPGPVVTWTRNSRHLDGRAADVVIDGGYDNAAGFQRLARVAREEGLRTLWPRDPGHVELPTTGSSGRTPSAPAPDAQPMAAPRAGSHEVLPAVPRAARAGIDPQAGRIPSPMPSANDGVPLAVPTIPAVPAIASVASAPVIAHPTDGNPRVRLDALARTVAASATRTSPAPQAPAALPNGEAWEAAPVAAAGGETGVARVARVATVASVAEVARVARVARVAEVAVPGQAAAPSAPAAPNTSMPGQVIAGQAAPMGGRAASGDGGASRERSHGRDARDDRTVHALPVAAAPDGRDHTPLALARELVALTGTREAGRDGDGSPVAGLARSDAAERIARVLRLQEAGGDRPLSSVLLRLETPDGGEDRIRVDMRGKAIGATLDVADARAAEQLRAHVPELQEALQRQGLEGDGLVVRSASRNSDAATFTASAASVERDLARAASATASDGGGSTARDSRNPPRASQEREGTDQQRSRQRRDGKEGRQ